MKSYLLAILLLVTGGLSLQAQLDSTSLAGSWRLVTKPHNDLHTPITAASPADPEPTPDQLRLLAANLWQVWTFEEGWAYLHRYHGINQANRYRLQQDGTQLVLADTPADTLFWVDSSPDTLRLARWSWTTDRMMSYLDTLTFRRDTVYTLPAGYRTMVQQKKLGDLRLDGLYETPYPRELLPPDVVIPADWQLSLFLRFYADSTVLIRVDEYERNVPLAARCRFCDRTPMERDIPFIGLFPFTREDNSIRVAYTWRDEFAIEWLLTPASDDQLYPTVLIGTEGQERLLPSLDDLQFLPIADQPYIFVED